MRPSSPQTFTFRWRCVINDGTRSCLCMWATVKWQSQYVCKSVVQTHIHGIWLLIINHLRERRMNIYICNMIWNLVGNSAWGSGRGKEVEAKLRVVGVNRCKPSSIRRRPIIRTEYYWSLADASGAATKAMLLSCLQAVYIEWKSDI